MNTRKHSQELPDRSRYTREWRERLPITSDDELDYGERSWEEQAANDAGKPLTGPL